MAAIVRYGNLERCPCLSTSFSPLYCVSVTTVLRDRSSAGLYEGVKFVSDVGIMLQYCFLSRMDLTSHEITNTFFMTSRALHVYISWSCHELLSFFADGHMFVIIWDFARLADGDVRRFILPHGSPETVNTSNSAKSIHLVWHQCPYFLTWKHSHGVWT